MKVADFLKKLENGAFDSGFRKLYGGDKATMDRQKKRYKTALERFVQTYPGNDEIYVFSAPGRTEVGGNHTDHQCGCVLAAAVDVDIIGVVSFNSKGVIRVLSEGYSEITVETDNLTIHPEENGSAAIIRGIAAKFKELGVTVDGFDMYATSDVLGGSGISSSAAFETLMGTVIDKYYNDGKLGAVEIAKIGQFAENVYFGKKSGLMDQMVSSVGGFVFIDFCDPQKPVIESCTFDFENAGYKLFITDTKGSHADLTDDYAAITSEMRQIANYFGKEVLREVESSEFMEELPNIRKTASDRACLRAMHFFAENNRAKEEFEKLKQGDVNGFLDIVNESGKSSAELLQNLYSCKKPTEQAIPLALAVSRSILGDKGAERVHGGGFAGTIQSFVPQELSEEYKAAMDKLFGEGSCRLMKIRPAGGISFTEYCKNN